LAKRRKLGLRRYIGGAVRKPSEGGAKTMSDTTPGQHVFIVEENGQLFAEPVVNDAPLSAAPDIPGSSAFPPVYPPVEEEHPTLRFANFRARGKRNRCEPCTCRSRSHFFFLDDNSAYNVDTNGTIWYQAADVLIWKPLYRCRNYIPWSTGISRLDHKLRDAAGYNNSVTARESLKIPCGRPTSGSFIGFQTDNNSCVHSLITMHPLTTTTLRKIIVTIMIRRKMIHRSIAIQMVFGT